MPAAVILAAAAVYVLTGARIGTLRDAGTRPSPPLHEVVAVCGFAAVPFVCVTLAKVVTGAFVNRYALPAVIGLAALAGFGVAAVSRRHPTMRLLTAACLIGWFALAQAREIIEPTGHSVPISQATVDRPVQWVAAAPGHDLPVVVADPHTFTVLSYYGAPRSGPGSSIWPTRISR